MKKVIYSLLFLSLLVAITFSTIKALDILEKKFPTFLMDNKIVKDNDQEVLAVYDPEAKILRKPEHYRLQLKANSDWQLETNELKVIPIDQPILLTIEIWGKRVLDSISEGNYDKKIENVLTPLANHPNLLVRFNPEMEISSSEAPWANWGDFYVKAFQRFSKITKRILPEAIVVWAPAGALGNMEYYPRKDYFEAASISLDIKDETDLFLKDKKPSEILERKLHRMRFLNVPLLVLGPKKACADREQKMFAAVFKKYEKVKKTTNIEDLQAVQKLRTGVPPEIGVYDPKGLLVTNDNISMEHIFMGLDSIQNGTFEKRFSEILSRDHDVIITVEPKNYSDFPEESSVLKGLIAGNFDHLLEKFYEIIPEDSPAVYIRFAHEMEIPVDRYPWQKQDPVLYINAFRYFMKFPGSTKNNIKKVWAPAGDRGSVEWWPGSDVVDYISMSIYGLPDKNITDFNLQDSFEEIYTRKKRRLDLFGKPFFIAEFGVKGDEEYQKRWMLEAAEVLNKNKEILGVSYFNQQDLPKAWGEIQPPDWSISSRVFQEFSEAILKQP